MKIGIITHYDVHNHGAQLQLYALSTELRQMGNEAQALQYKKNYDFLEQGIENKYSISIKSIPIYVKYLLKKGFKRTLYNIRKRKVLNKFRDNEKLNGEYYSKATNLDATVIGSDEIFSIEPGLNPWFWGMGIPCDHIISYAASFGPTTLSFIKKKRAEEFIEAGAKRIDKISVRDQNSKDIINTFSSKEVSLVCDPVLLHDFTKERQCNKAKKGNKKYCVVYSYDDNMNDEETVKSIKAYAKSRGLKVYSVGYYHKWCDKNIQVPPLEVFDWFANSQAVFTDTFHGSVISLVTNANVFAKVTTNKNKLGFLLEQYGIADRRVSSFTEIEELSKHNIDYGKVNNTIVEIRQRSIDYLKNAIGEVK